MNFDDNSIKLKLNLQKNTAKGDSELGEKVIAYTGEVDYVDNVKNKPTLDGKTIVGDMFEEDPTMQPLELSEINDMFNQVFGE